MVVLELPIVGREVQTWCVLWKLRLFQELESVKEGIYSCEEVSIVWCDDVAPHRCVGCSPRLVKAPICLGTTFTWIEIRDSKQHVLLYVTFHKLSFIELDLLIIFMQFLRSREQLKSPLFWWVSCFIPGSRFQLLNKVLKYQSTYLHRDPNYCGWRSRVSLASPRLLHNFSGFPFKFSFEHLKVPIRALLCMGMSFSIKGTIKVEHGRRFWLR